MIILTQNINLYGKRVIEDVVSRAGTREMSNSFSPYDGMSSVVWKYAKKYGDIGVSPEVIMQAADCDFDADVKDNQPKYAPEDEIDTTDLTENERLYDPAIDPIAFDGYRRRLDDIHPYYIERYIGFVVYRMLFQDGTFARLQRENAVQNAVAASTDDGDDMLEAVDLLLRDNRDYDEDERDKAKLMLPYTLKRLHCLSVLMGVHMLSYVCSYLRAQEDLNRQRQGGSVRTLHWSAVANINCWRADSKGDAMLDKPQKAATRNKNIQEAFAWITGRSKINLSYLQDVTDLQYYFSVLNIDYVNDRMELYGSEFMQSLTCTTVTPNKQYEQTIYDSLMAREGLASRMLEAPTDEDVILDTQMGFLQLIASHDKLNKSVEDLTSQEFDNIKQFATNIYYKHALNSSYMINTDDISWINGWMHYRHELVVLPTHCVTSNDNYGSSFIISETGYCVMLIDNNVLRLLPVNDALTNITELGKRTSKFDYDEFKYKTWRFYDV